MASESLDGLRAEQPQAQAARTYASAFQAMAVAAITPGYLLCNSAETWRLEMARLGLGELVADVGPMHTTSRGPE